MTADVELPPLPEGEAIGWTQAWSYDQMRSYARANVAHATAAKDAEIEALRAEVEVLRVSTFANATVHIGIERDRAEARAERLAEALRAIRRDALDGCSAMDCARDAYDVLSELGLADEGESHG